MKSRIYYITYRNSDNLIATKPYVATSEKRALKLFNMTDIKNKTFIKISTDII